MMLELVMLEKAVNKTRRGVPKGLGQKMKHRHRNAIVKASERLAENPFISYENGKLLILSDSRTEAGEAKFYETSRTGLCATPSGKASRVGTGRRWQSWKIIYRLPGNSRRI
jgi:hypothetical protein